MRTRIPHGSKAPTVRHGSEAPTVRQGSGAPTVRRGRSDAPLVLGRYRLRRRLGTGGFASVWLARDERLDRDVAVKILPRERVLGGRFEREARAAARLSHPGIVTLYEAAVDDEGAYLVSELVHGATLDELLAAGRLSDHDVVQIGIALCDALAHAHANGVIHRDVKPSNVLVPERPTTAAQLARLTDFGVARVLGGDSLTRTGDVIGTAAYMAPEQAQGLPAGAAADVFSLALVLYAALSGVNPLRTGPAAQRTRRLGAHLPPLRRQRRELPRELGRVIDLALRPRPGERSSLEELRGALAAATGRMDDEPGVIAAPWPARTGIRRDSAAFAAGRDADDRPAAVEEDREAPDGPVALRGRTPEAGSASGIVSWPRRALAGVAAAAVTAWLTRHVPGASPVPAALTACVAGVLVAALPRAGWLALTLAVAGSLIVHAHPGAALLLVAAALVPAVLSPRDGPAWPLAAVAPALAGLGLAGAWPALAGMAGRTRRRAVLGATGWLWMALWSAGIARTASLHDAIHRVLTPIVTTGALASCAAWALAAILLPWTRTRHSAGVECVRVGVWATALALATVAAARLGSGGPTPSLGAALLGAWAGGLVAFASGRWGRRLEGGRRRKTPHQPRSMDTR